MTSEQRVHPEGARPRRRSSFRVSYVEETGDVAYEEAADTELSDDLATFVLREPLEHGDRHGHAHLAQPGA